MRYHTYQAEHLCSDCGDLTVLDLEKERGRSMTFDDFDSNEWPQLSDDDCEADSPQYCGQCNQFLCNSLTEDGYVYLIDGLNDVLKQNSNSQVLMHYEIEVRSKQFDY